ncbi:Fis family transcriptional regulator [Endozoicomonas sp. 8E]|uniref:Fis family transcriptional regulator n=1 Tax=Endozoicomonas sp. 8E TaxID=3035692 RepID=UPI0029392FA3|nr:Fis family transcriptional regulator [Endozoicomonas sp. 8E]WOG30171.1 Fis family transcriptional regulator [Endozoicomonas sp. 8E]
MSNPYIGSSFDDFLEEEGLLPECQAEAIKRVLAWQISEYLEKEKVNKSTFARRLGTSRSQLDRLLDPNSTSLNLKTLANAAQVMGRKLELRIV